MMRRVAFLTVLALMVTAASGLAADDRYWPQWRGPLATGVAPGADPPTEWSETRNVRWKVAIPGLGRLLVDSIANRNYPVIQGVTLIIAVVYVFINLLVDLSYIFLDPRIKY